MRTRVEVVTACLIEGIEDLAALQGIVRSELGQEVSLKVLGDYRSRFRKFGPEWPQKVAAHNAETHRIASRRWKQANTARRLLHQCRSSARYRQQECTITEEAIAELLVNFVCSMTGLPLSIEWKGPSGTNPWAPSIDRLDNALGYIPGNIRLVCWAFNNMRGDFPDEVVETLVKAYAAKLS